MWQRCLPAGANKVGISDRGGLRAGRKRRSTENDDKQLNDVPGPSGRDGARFNSEVRALGTIDGRHVATPILPPRSNPTRNGGRTVAGRDQGRINLLISFGCDYCATTRRKRDVLSWTICFEDASLGVVTRVSHRYGLGRTRYRKMLTRAMLGWKYCRAQSSYLTKHNS